MKLPLLLTALAATTAQAQLNLYLENTQDLFSLCVAPTVTQPNPFFIGNNPSVIALSGDRLFVAGYNNTGAQRSDLRVVKIENIFGARAFRFLQLGTDGLGQPVYDTTMPSFRGYYGMSYAPNAGLIVDYDAGAVGVAGGYRVFDVDTQLNPILIGSSPAGVGARGGAGPSWDFGPTGEGYDYNNDGLLDGPLAAILDFSAYPGGVQSKGPFGILPIDSAVGSGDGLNMFAGRRYDGNSVDGGGNATAPVLNTIGTNGNRVQGTLWRDSDINPVNGNIVARASNDVVIGVRNANGGLASHVVVDRSPGTTDPYAFQIMQRCEWVTGLSSDVVVYNDYSAAASTIEGWTKAADLNGNSVTINMFNADGSPFTATAASGLMDYSYDPETGRLAICDFAGRRVFIFSTTPPVPPCPWAADSCFSDYNNDGGIDGDDVIAFFAAWDSSDNCADVDNSGGVDGDDVINFFAAWDAGGVGFPGCE
jgi:hypothetical protein